MLNRAHSRLTLRWFVLLLIAGIALPIANTQHPEHPTVIGLSADETIREFAERNDLRVLDSAGNHHLVLATTEEAERLRQQPGVHDVEADFAVSVSELGLAGDAAALLNPNTVAVLNNPDMVSHGGALIKKSVVRQTAIKLIECEYENESHGGIGGGVRVAVIDTGIDSTHPALSGRVLPGVNVIDGGTDVEDPLPAELAWAQLNPATVALLNPNTVAVLNPNTVAVLNQPQFRFYGHGTLVGGLIHTVAPDAWLVPFKAFTASGMTSSFTVAKAIRQATDMNVDVINMSFDFDRPSSVVREALDYAASRGVVMIASAGNGGTIAAVYPAIHPGVIAVASTDMKDRKTAFSNYGPAVSVSAPGELLFSTYPGNEYAAVAGTSFSAALVTGEAARIQSLGRLTAGEIRGRIQKAVKRIGELNPGIQLGTGRIKVHSALESESESESESDD
jgi:subtilisin family serine protease